MGLGVAGRCRGWCAKVCLGWGGLRLGSGVCELLLRVDMDRSLSG